jgi:hypothetical protein
MSSSRIVKADRITPGTRTARNSLLSHNAPGIQAVSGPRQAVKLARETNDTPSPRSSPATRPGTAA